MSYVYVGTYVESLESGCPLAHGETTDTADQRLIDAGLLVPAETESTPPSPPAAPVAPVTTVDQKEPSADASGT